MTLSLILRERASLDPGAEAVVSQGRRISYGELNHQVDRLATALTAGGIRPGARVAVWLSK